MVKRRCIVVVAAIIILVAFLVLRERCSIRDVQDLSFLRVEAGGCGDAVVRSAMLDRPVDKPTSDSERAMLKASYDEIVKAWLSGRSDEMMQWESRLPAMAEKMRDEDVKKAGAIFFGMLFNEFAVKDAPLRDFDSGAQFNLWMRSNLAAARLYGKVCVARKNFSGFNSVLEAKVLARLRGYKEKFAKSGMQGLESSADAFIAEWIAQIESKEGFSRLAALHWMEYSRTWGYDSSGNKQPWETLRDRAIMQGAASLIKAGYTPKWVKELKCTPR